MTKNTPSVSAMWETQKLNLAAFLIASNFGDLVEAYCSPASSSVAFRFSKEPTQEQVASFYNGSAMVSALLFSNSLTNLKAAVFEAKRRGRSDNGFEH